MNAIDHLERREYELSCSALVCAASACRWIALCRDAIVECRRLRELLDKPVNKMDGGSDSYCPAYDEAPIGDPTPAEEPCSTS